ncbi:MAG TPA: hypothetical protein VIM98_12760, partial [Dyella sp.]|uniref:hypothetical protein n=1 Tax=Dyella sp. TaxID=1869338 RepID=UPI002F92FE51
MANPTSAAPHRQPLRIALPHVALALSAMTCAVAMAAQLEGENLLQPPLDGLDIVNRQAEGQA